MRSWLGADGDIGRLQNESELTATLQVAMKFASHLNKSVSAKAKRPRDSLFGSPVYLHPRVSVEQPSNQARVQYERLRTEPVIDSAIKANMPPWAPNRWPGRRYLIAPASRLLSRPLAGPLGPSATPTQPARQNTTPLSPIPTVD